MIDNYDITDIRFNALRSALMHNARRRKLERWGRFCNFVVIISGAAAAADVLGSIIGSGNLALLTAGVGALQLVFDFGGRARTHDFLQRRYFELIAKSQETPTIEEADLATLRGQLIRIYCDEPPISRLDEAIAYNEACESVGASREDQLFIPWWVRIFGSVLPTPKLSTNKELLLRNDGVKRKLGGSAVA